MKYQTLIAFLGGAVVGAATALLFAPEKGSTTRKKIKKMVKKERDKLRDTLNSVRKEHPELEEKIERMLAEDNKME
ncbi:MAG TPA: YtxH domain-containing protein [Candidatus Avirikenella pullistercoris]|nr:YtxH domain-containing protein [Candidatus Avirikenella pullistercoris]